MKVMEVGAGDELSVPAEILDKFEREWGFLVALKSQGSGTKVP